MKDKRRGQGSDTPIRGRSDSHSKVQVAKGVLLHIEAADNQQKILDNVASTNLGFKEDLPLKIYIY